MHTSYMDYLIAVYLLHEVVTSSDTREGVDISCGETALIRRRQEQ